MTHHVFFHPSIVALHREIKEHPKLLQYLAAYNVGDLPSVIAEAAAYCNIVVDGNYTQEQIEAMCDRLVFELRAKRMGLIVCKELPESTTKH